MRERLSRDKPLGSLLRSTQSTAGSHENPVGRNQSKATSCECYLCPVTLSTRLLHASKFEVSTLGGRTIRITRASMAFNVPAFFSLLLFPYSFSIRRIPASQSEGRPRSRRHLPAPGVTIVMYLSDKELRWMHRFGQQSSERFVSRTNTEALPKNRCLLLHVAFSSFASVQSTRARRLNCHPGEHSLTKEIIQEGCNRTAAERTAPPKLAIKHESQEPRSANDPKTGTVLTAKLLRSA